MKKYIPILLLLILILATIFVSYKLYSEAEEKAIDYQYKQQELYANQAVLSIQNFFENLKHSLSFLSTRNEVINNEYNLRNVLKEFFYSHSNELNAITRISAEGKILFTYPYIEEVIGMDVSDQPHNAEIIKAHKPSLSDVFMTVQGYRAIAYAYPIFKDEKYNGSISIVIPFDLIARKFLEPISFGKMGTAFVLSKDGIELFCSVNKHVGFSIHDHIEGFDELSALVSNMLNKNEGRAQYSYFLGSDKKEIVKKIAVFKPIELENTFWSIAVIIPQNEVLEANRGFFQKFIGFLSLMLLIVILFGYIFYRQKQKVRKIIEEKENKYRSDLEYLVKARTKELNILNEELRNDIIKRKKVEEKLKETVSKAERSEKIKTDFLAQVSHEIRTPINTILSFSSLLKEQFYDQTNDELRYSFKGIESAGRRLIRTIDLILNMSDISAGTHDYIPKEIDIYEEIIKNLESEYKVQINEKKLKFDVINNTDNSYITADSYSVNQIFANLIDNAIKYTTKGGIKIICNRNEKDEMIVSVIDTGLGISEEYLPRIFEEFSQEDAGYTRKYEGNGLGLALVKKYCELNNAEINIESKKGKGSSFTVVFKDRSQKKF